MNMAMDSLANQLDYDVDEANFPNFKSYLLFSAIEILTENCQSSIFDLTNEGILERDSDLCVYVTPIEFAAINVLRDEKNFKELYESISHMDRLNLVQHLKGFKSKEIFFSEFLLDNWDFYFFEEKASVSRHKIGVLSYLPLSKLDENYEDNVVNLEAYKKLNLCLDLSSGIESVINDGFEGISISPNFKGSSRLSSNLTSSDLLEYYEFLEFAYIDMCSEVDVLENFKCINGELYDAFNRIINIEDRLK